MEQGNLVANASEPNTREPHAVDSPLCDTPVATPAPGNAIQADARRSEVLSELSERDVSILAFERQWWRHAGAKEQGIRAEFDLSAARYYQLLGALLDSPQALAHDPMLVKRLRRMRESRAEARARRSVPSP